MSISHSTCHLAPQGYFTAPSGRGVFGFPLYSPERQGRRDLFTSFPGAWRRVIGPSLGQSAALTKAPRNRCQTPPFPGPSRGGEAPLAAMPPPHDPPSSVATPRPLALPGAQARRVGAGSGGRLGSGGAACGRTELCRTPRSPGRTEAGSACSPGGGGVGEKRSLFGPGGRG